MQKYLSINARQLTLRRSLAMGHPLLEAAVDTILTRYGQSAPEGATFIDPEGEKDGVIWF